MSKRKSHFLHLSYHNRRQVISTVLVSFLAALVASPFGIAPPARAQGPHVVPDGFPTIQDAIDHADFSYNDTILVYYDSVYDAINITKPWKIIAKQGATIDGNFTSNVVTISANDTAVIGFTIRNSPITGYGIYVSNTSSGNTISGNIVSDNGIGVVFASSPGMNETQATSRNTLANNMIVNNTFAGLVVAGGGHSIFENTLISNGLGMCGSAINSLIYNNTVVSSSLLYTAALSLSGYNNTVECNRVADNQGFGIGLFSNEGGGFRNLARRNILSNTSYGIHLVDVEDCEIVDNNMSRNTDAGILLENSTSSLILNNTIRGITNETNGVYVLNSIGNTIVNNSFLCCSTCIYLGNSGKSRILENKGSASEYGLNLVDSFNNTISRNSWLHMSKYGMYLFQSSSNNLSMNSIWESTNGALLNSSNENGISSNEIFNSTRIGFSMENSINNALTTNILAENRYNFGVSGSEKVHFNHSIDESNLVNDRSIRYLKNENDLTVEDSGIGYLALINCSKITVRCLSLTRNLQGILMVSTNQSRIEQVTLQDNWHGISLKWSRNNTLSRNSIQNTLVHEDSCGINLFWSNRNTIVESGLRNNDCGIYMYISASNNVTHNNIQYDETTKAMFLRASWNNIIYNNSFYTTEVWFGGGYMLNHWNHSGTGNYWHECPLVEPNNVDYHPLERPVMSTLVADFDYDGDVDIFDIVIVAAAYDSTPQSFNWNIYVDVNEPYWIIDIFDVVLAATKYGSEWSCHR
jgi:parallel beta-helix repeat protein